MISALSFSSYADDIFQMKIQDTDMSAYKGKTLLIVNIATRCGYTPQLEGLEKLYQSYKDKGLVILGIPSNDFGGQTPEKNEKVKEFCSLKYGVTFPLTNKAVVKGDKKEDLIAWLIKKSGSEQEIGWNFEKFLVDKSGKNVERFQSGVEPDSKDLKLAIEKKI